MRRLALGLLAFLAWAPFDARAGSEYTPPASGGGSASADVVPDYLAVDGEATLDPADWIDAATIGGPDSVDLEVMAGGAILTLALNRKADGTGITGARAQGRLTAIDAGDFLVGFRVGVGSTTDVSTALSSTMECGAVFVDGTDLDTSSWYGGLAEWNGTSIASGPAMYALWNTSGANRFGLHHGGGEFLAFASLMGAYDTSMTVWLARSGTNLTMYLSTDPGALPMVAKVWTVSAGAGYAGPRCHFRNVAGENTVSLHLLKYRYQASAVLPWLP